MKEKQAPVGNFSQYKKEERQNDHDAKELLHLKRKELIERLVKKLSEEDQNFYYYPTVEVAALIIEYRDQGKLNLQDKALIEELNLQDIQVLLSHKNS